MKANELRIDNWYNSVKFNQPVQCDLSDLYELFLKSDGAYGDPPIEEMFEPIIITEEWLLKFGFEVWLDCYVLHNAIDGTSNFEVTLADGKAYASIDGNACCWVKELYVHTLQNLFFGITGSELYYNNNEADKYLADNIIEARNNHDKACEVYRNYVGTAETQEERLRRINAFRCGGH